MKQETISKLITLANEAFETRLDPDLYARAAAHRAAVNSASLYNPDCADAAALAAANTFACAATLATSYSANIADVSFNSIAYAHSHAMAEDSVATRIEQQPTKTAEPIYLEPANAIYDKALAFESELTQSYESLPAGNTPESNKNAKRAALYVYADTYTTCRSAYVRAMFEASQISNTEKSGTQFTQIITAKLTNDLNYDVVEPGFFLNLMCSTSLNVIAGLLLLTGIAGITLGTFGIAALPFIATIAAGSVASTLGTGLLISGFFARRQKNYLEEKNEQRMHKEPAPSTLIATEAGNT